MRIRRRSGTGNGLKTLRLREVELYDKNGNIMNINNAKAEYKFVDSSNPTAATTDAGKCGNGVVDPPGAPLTDYCSASANTVAGSPVLEIKLSACLRGLSRVVVHAGLQNAPNTDKVFSKMEEYEAIVSWRGEAIVALTPAFNNSDLAYSYSYSFTPAKV